MTSLILIADPGKALDDEEMFVLLSRLIKLGLCRALAVVTNLGPAVYRAKLTRGTFDALAMSGVPVGIGFEVVAGHVQDVSDLNAVSYFSTDAVLANGQELLRQTLEAAEDNSVTLLLASAMTDSAAILRSDEALFAKKVSCVVIMGGVTTDGTTPTLTDGFLTPDSASNNFYDMPAAEFVYRRLQELKIKMLVLSRHAAYATKVPRAIYDQVAATGHPVGAKLSHFYAKFINDFWKVVNAPEGDAIRAGLPARWNRELFLETFCGGRGADRSADESVLDLVEYASFSDPMTLIAAIPSLRARYYTPHKVTVLEVEHELIGVGADATGVADTDALVTFLVDNIVGALQDTVPTAEVAPKAQPPT